MRHNSKNPGFYFAFILISTICWMVPERGFTQPFQSMPSMPFLDDTSYSRGLSWIDVDGDDDLDVFLSGIGTASAYPKNQLFINNTGVFSLSPILSPTMPSSFGNGWSDIDNDGDPDAYVAATWNNGAFNELYANNAGLSFTQLTGTGATPSASLPYEGTVSWGDYNNDGYTDLYLVRWNNQGNVLYRSNTGSSFSAIGGQTIVTDANWSSAGVWGDYDNDGDVDMYVANYSTSGPNRLYRNDGGGTFTAVTTAGQVVTDMHNSRSANWVDHNNDGFLDLFVANQNASDRLYTNNGNGTFSAGQNIGGSATTWTSNWGDLDNDGDQDLLTMGLWGADNHYWRNDGGGSFTDINPGSIMPNTTNGSSGMGISIIDYDNDGRLDIHFRRSGTGASGQDFFYRNLVDSCKSRLLIKCVGTTSNRSAIGAIVRAKADILGTPTWQMRQISAQTSKGGQNSQRVHFGFEDATIIDSLIVEWPSAISCTLTNVPVNQMIEIVEGCTMNSLSSFVGCGPLPVVLQHFSGDLRNDGSVKLHWETQLENEKGYFLVDRSVDGRKFSPFSGQLNSDCSDFGGICELVDHSPFPARSYYRLFFISTNGDQQYLGQVSIATPVEDLSLAVFPNPATDIVEIKVEASSGIEGVSVLNSLGALCLEKGQIRKGLQCIALDVSGLRAGIYWIKVKASGRSIYKKLVVE